MTAFRKVFTTDQISKLYYDLYRAQMHRDWKSAELIQKKLQELEEQEKRIDVA